jgi:hypothetical protein
MSSLLRTSDRFNADLELADPADSDTRTFTGDDPPWYVVEVEWWQVDRDRLFWEEVDACDSHRTALTSLHCHVWLLETGELGQPPAECSYAIAIDVRLREIPRVRGFHIP